MMANHLRKARKIVAIDSEVLEQLEEMQCDTLSICSNLSAGHWSSSGLTRSCSNLNAASEGAFSDRDARTGSEPRRLAGPDADVSANARMAMSLSKT